MKVACPLAIILLISFSCYSQELRNSNEFTATDLNAAIDSSWVLYDAHDKEGMKDYLEQFDPEVVQNDTAALEYYYAAVIVYGHLSELDKQFESIVAGLRLAHKIKDDWMLLSLYRELGSIHDEALDEYDVALGYYREAIKYLDAVAGDSKSGLMMDIGLTCTAAGLLDTAVVYYKKAFEYLPDDNPTIKADVHTFYAPYLVKTKQYDEAERILDYSYNYWKAEGYRRPIVDNVIDYAELYYYRGEFDKGLNKLNEGLQILQEVPDVLKSSKIYRWKAKTEKELGLIEESLKSFEMVAILKDSLTEIENKHQIGKKKLAFVVEQYKTELDTLKSSNLQLSSSSVRSKTMLSFTIGVLLLLSGLFYFLLKRRKTNNKKLKDQLGVSLKQLDELKEDYTQTINELEQNKRELTSTAMFVEKKDEALKSVRKLLSKVEVVDNAKIAEAIRTARKLAENSISADSSWESFLYFFDRIYPSFLSDARTRFPQLNSNDLRTFSYIKMGLTDKEVSRLLGINTASFQKAKYRLKKKLNLDNGISLEEMISKI